MLFVGKLHSARLFQIDSELVLSNATPSTQELRQSWIRLETGGGVKCVNIVKFKAKTQQELNLRRHELIIGFQHLPWKRYNRIRKQISSEVTPNRLAKWARQLNGSQAGTAKRTKMATYLGTTLSRHLLQISR